MSDSNQIPTEWYFITAPQSVTWSKDSNNSMIDTYGTNNPYLHYGTTKLRQLNLNNSMLEGFSAGVAVEGNVRALEQCMQMVIDDEVGYVAPYCWHVYAAGKKYGTFIIQNVNITEDMRDNSGNAVRANVDVSLQEVSPYQIATGEDITSEAITGGFSEEVDKQLQESQKQDQKAEKDKGGKGNSNKGNSGNSGSSSGGGSNNGGGGSSSGGGGSSSGGGGYSGPNNVSGQFQ